MHLISLLTPSLHRLIHPLSPRGKLVHKGLEGLKQANYLIDQAVEASRDAPVILRNELYRLAVNQQQALALQKTALDLPHLATWIDRHELASALSPSSSQVLNEKVVGGLRLTNGCKVIHVPSYLQALFAACQQLAGKERVSWTIVDNEDPLAQEGSFSDYDAVVLACGSGLFQNTRDNQHFATILQKDQWPIQLVRGQSVEMTLDDELSLPTDHHALLSGKYISPLPESNRILVGATHEYQSTPLSEHQVVTELRERTEDMAPSYIWEMGQIDRLTQGVRVQSERGKFGRLPIIGKVPASLLGSSSGTFHSNIWIFTGLSSRGLLYHGLYGDLLADAILTDSNYAVTLQGEDLLWWQR